jgi:hypothetical protein
MLDSTVTVVQSMIYSVALLTQTLYACMYAWYTLQGGVPSSINVGDTLSLRFQAQDSFANDVFVGGAGTLLCIVCTAIAA